MVENGATQSHRQTIDSQTKYLTNAYDKLKWKLRALAELKRQGKSSDDEQVKQMHAETIQLLALNKSCMRTVIDTVETLRRQCENQRSATDDHNLTLQSYLYETGYYEKQIHFCKEYKTPQLDKVIEKAKE